MSIVLGSGGPSTCTQVAAAAKSAPSVRDQLQQKKAPADNLLMNDAGTHLKRVVTGELKATDNLKEEASAALSIFKSLSDKKAKIEFSRKILENRKSLQRCKSWQQQYEEKTATRTCMVSGCMTRTIMNF